MSLPPLKENLVFFREFLAEFDTTGTIWPTSPFAAEALTAPLRERDRALEIIELGPGTGSVTVRILKDMRPHDRLTICEINPRFMKTLKEALRDNPDFLKHQERVRFIECPAQELPEDRHYDVVVCALPFLNFELVTVKEIFEKLRKLSKPETVMTYYEYIGLRKINKTVSQALGKERIHEVDSYLRSLYQLHRMSRKRVWLNMLPINVYRLELGTSIPSPHTNGAPHVGANGAHG